MALTVAKRKLKKIQDEQQQQQQQSTQHMPVHLSSTLSCTKEPGMRKNKKKILT